MVFEDKEINITQWTVSASSDSDGFYTAILQAEIPKLDKENKDHKFTSFCTAEAMRLVKKEYEFQTLDIFSPCTIFNNTTNKGTWVFYGKFLVNKDSEWLYKNKDALQSVRKGLQQAAEKKYVRVPDRDGKLPVNDLEVSTGSSAVMDGNEQLEVFESDATIESRSRTKRLKGQKEK